MKDTAALKNGDKVVTSPGLSKLKSTRMYMYKFLCFVTIVTVFSINYRYSNGSILSSVSIVSNVLLQVLLVMCI